MFKLFKINRLANILLLSISFILLTSGSCNDKQAEAAKQEDNLVQTAIGPLVLPPPYATESAVKRSEVKGWEDGQTPIPPAGFTVTRFAEGLDNPRWIYVAPNKDIFVVESKPGRITLLHSHDGKVVPAHKKVFIEDLNRPFGMLVLNDYFYVANTGGLYRYAYNDTMTSIEEDGEMILELPDGGYNHHWTRNLLPNKNGSKIYVSVGSASNVGEQGLDKEIRRAAILEINPDGSGEKIYASGIRNPVGMDWNPVTGELWAAVNERDKLGNNLVPDYITSVKEGGFYGWPFSYYGQIKDPRWQDDPHNELVQKAIVPDVPVGNHTASLGLQFYTGDQFPAKYKNGAFVGQHGSWNRANFAGYKVVFVPFKDGKPQPPEDFLTGFIADEQNDEVYGRPVGVHQIPDGSLLVVDDEAGIVWKVTADNK